jgi:hypothetical protein
MSANSPACSQRLRVLRDATWKKSFIIPTTSANGAHPDITATWNASLVECFVSGVLQPLDLVLHHQFPALQFGYLQVVRRKVDKSFVQFVLKALVFPFQFNEMCLNGHSKPPWLLRNRRFHPDL